LEPGEATKTWLHLPFESREGLQLRLHTWSRCSFHRLAGLRPEPLVEPEPEPSQTGPRSQRRPPGQVCNQISFSFSLLVPIHPIQNQQISYVICYVTRVSPTLLLGRRAWPTFWSPPPWPTFQAHTSRATAARTDAPPPGAGDLPPAVRPAARRTCSGA
jgi:hypothetical protein